MRKRTGNQLTENEISVGPGRTCTTVVIVRTRNNRARHGARPLPHIARVPAFAAGTVPRLFLISQRSTSRHAAEGTATETAIAIPNARRLHDRFASCGTALLGYSAAGGTIRMRLVHLILALMLFPAVATAQYEVAPEGLAVTTRSLGEVAVEVRRTGRVARAAEDPTRSGGPRMSIRVYGGSRQLVGGDVNEAARNSAHATLNSLYEGYFPVEDDDIAAVDSATEFGADIIIHLSRRLGLVGGVGLINSSEECHVEIPARGPNAASEQTSSLTMRSVPARFGLQYSVPLGGRLNLLLEGGKVVELMYSPGYPVLVVGEGTRTMDRYGPFRDEKDASVGLSGLRYTGGLRVSF